jgi:hypothetical protein
MTKTKTRRVTEPDEFEPDFYAELLESLAKPLDCEPADPAPRINKRTRWWGRSSGREVSDRPGSAVTSRPTTRVARPAPGSRTG